MYLAANPKHYIGHSSLSLSLGLGISLQKIPLGISYV